MLRGRGDVGYIRGAIAIAIAIGVAAGIGIAIVIRAAIAIAIAIAISMGGGIAIAIAISMGGGIAIGIGRGSRATADVIDSEPGGSQDRLANGLRGCRMRVAISGPVHLHVHPCPLARPGPSRASFGPA